MQVDRQKVFAVMAAQDLLPKSAWHLSRSTPPMPFSARLEGQVDQTLYTQIQLLKRPRMRALSLNTCLEIPIPLQEGLEELTLHIDRPADLPQVFPNSLKVVHLVKSHRGYPFRFNVGMYLNRLPPNLPELTVSGNICDIEDDYAFPPGLKKLLLRDVDNLLPFPECLEELIVIGGYTDVFFPPNLISLSLIATDQCRDTTCVVHCQQTLELDPLPVSLQKLEISRYKLLHVPPLPGSLLHLDLGSTIYNGPLDLPDSLLTISLPRGFRDPILIPPRLEELTFASDSMCTTELALPDTLRVLKLPPHYDVGLTELPPTLVVLEMRNNNVFNYILPPLPTTLETLILGDAYTHAFQSLPHSLRYLWLGEHYKHALPAQRSTELQWFSKWS